MRSFVLVPVCALLFAGSAGVRAQDSKSWISAQWKPLTEENERLYRQAEAGFEVAVAQAQQKAEDAQRPDHRASRQELDAAGVPSEIPNSGSGPLKEGGMSGPMGPGSTNVGKRRKHQERWLTLQELLPPTLDFAAPRSGGLILQRTSTSVLFGRTDSDELVMLPLSGEDTDIAHGLRASIHEGEGYLRLMVGLPTGSQVLFEYHPDPDPAKHGMSVDIRIGGGPPGTGIELKRIYRQAQVNVGALKKAGQ
jgi:hypothetical protein